MASSGGYLFFLYIFSYADLKVNLDDTVSLVVMTILAIFPMDLIISLIAGSSISLLNYFFPKTEQTKQPPRNA